MNVLAIVIPVLKRILRDILMFCEDASKLRLRHYQQEVAQAIVQSVISKAGDTIVVLFPRQSGKNELQAQVETYLLTLFFKPTPKW